MQKRHSLKAAQFDTTTGYCLKQLLNQATCEFLGIPKVCKFLRIKRHEKTRQQNETDLRQTILVKTSFFQFWTVNSGRYRLRKQVSLMRSATYFSTSSRFLEDYDVSLLDEKHW